MLVDVIFPGWSPFLELAVTTNPFEFIKANDDVLAYDFETMVSGHLGRTATRADVGPEQGRLISCRPGRTSLSRTFRAKTGLLFTR